MVTKFISEIIPYEYQIDSLGAIKLTQEMGKKTALVIMATGLGKTVVTALEAKRRLENDPTVRGLFLCHQNDILEQAQIDYQLVLGPDVSYGFFHGEEKSSHTASIVFGSFQTMRENLNGFDPNEFDFIVVDETHHSGAPTYEKVIRYFTPNFLLGITATSERMDGFDIREIYGDPIYNLPLTEALARGLLCPVEYRLMSDEIGSLKSLETEHGRLSTKFLNRTIFVRQRDEQIASKIQDHMNMISEPRVMVFVSSIEHAELLAEMIPGSAPIHSKITKYEKKARLQLFRDGVFKVAITVDMFNEALDIPEANLIVFLRSTSSPTLYFHQLGRGLRRHPSKTKVIVLDFVANCERVLSIYELWTKVKTEKEKKSVVNSTSTSRNGINQKEEIQPFMLNIAAAEFQEKIIPLIETLRKMREEFYSSWQEASVAAKQLNISTVNEYREKYKQDYRLVSMPSSFYEDFPGWYEFLGNNVKNFYPTWQEASEAAIKLGIISMRAYGRDKKRKADPRLHSLPQFYYPDFPGWKKFLGKEKEYYSTWKEASAAAIAIGVTTEENYKTLRKNDPKLHGSPRFLYEDFPGWMKFLNKKEKEFYLTWKEASEAAKNLGIKSCKEYKDLSSSDPKLPKGPSTFYEDFPGWPKFLRVKVIKKYSTWQKASKAVQKLGIKNWESYSQNYKKDPKLPAAVSEYYEDYPGSNKFFGVDDFYPTWEEAFVAIKALGIKDSVQYRKLRKSDPRLCVRPEGMYKDFPGWRLIKHSY